MPLIRILTPTLLLLAASNGLSQPAARDSVDGEIAAVMEGLSFPVELEESAPARMPIAERLAFHRVPGVAVAVVLDGRVRWARGFGVKAHGSADPIEAATLFQVASISKPVSALTALRLVAEERLDLDERANATLHAWRIPDNEFTAEQPVTLRHILSHSAGLTNGAVGIYAPGDSLPTLLQALEGEPPSKRPPVRVDFLPGTRGRYAGGGYSVLQQLLIDATGEPFPALAKRLVLDPLAMKSSGFLQPLPDSLVERAATGHDGDGKPIPGGWWTLPEMAAGGLWSTATDMAKLAIGLIDAWRGAEEAILPQSLAREMMRDQIEGFGLGTFVDDVGGEVRVSHTGSNDGYRAVFVVFPERGDAIIVLTNGDRGDALRDEIVRSAARVHGWPGYTPAVRAAVEVSPELLTELTGRYDYGGGFVTHVTLENGQLRARLGSGPDYELFAASQSEFFSLGGTSYTFRRDEEGKVVGLDADVGGGRPLEGEKISESSLP